MAKSITKRARGKDTAANINTAGLLGHVVMQKGKDNNAENREAAAAKVLDDLVKVLAKHHLTDNANTFEVKLGDLTISADNTGCPPGCNKCRRHCKEIVDAQGKVVGMKCRMICIDP